MLKKTPIISSSFTVSFFYTFKGQNNQRGSFTEVFKSTGLAFPAGQIKHRVGKVFKQP
jgi:hypothetical protein